MRAVTNEEDRETLIFGSVAEREREEKAPSKVRKNKISFLSFVMFFFLFSKLERKRDKKLMSRNLDLL